MEGSRNRALRIAAAVRRTNAGAAIRYLEKADLRGRLEKAADGAEK